MFKLKYTQVALAAGLLITSVIVAFPEPFEMESTIHKIVDKHLEDANKKASDDLGNHGYDLSSAESKSTEVESVDHSSSLDSR